jgi:hypothetical protein
MLSLGQLRHCCAHIQEVQAHNLWNKGHHKDQSNA